MTMPFTLFAATVHTDCRITITFKDAAIALQ